MIYPNAVMSEYSCITWWVFAGSSSRDDNMTIF